MNNTDIKFQIYGDHVEENIRKQFDYENIYLLYEKIFIMKIF